MMLIFDFDGVIINSLTELVITSYNAVTEKTVASEEELPAEYHSLFSKNRFHVQPASDFITFATWCLENYQTESEKLLTAEEYRAIVDLADSQASERTIQLFSARKRFVENHKQQWLDLHSCYEPLCSALRDRPDHPLVILTHKNRTAVVELCQYFTLPLMPECVYSGDDGLSKTENLKLIRDRFPASRYYFIDDSLRNLTALRQDFSEDELFLILAKWGYLGPNDVQAAVSGGFRAYSQDKLLEFLKSEKLL